MTKNRASHNSSPSSVSPRIREACRVASICACAALMMLSGSMLAQQKDSRPKNDAGDVARGKYLVESVAVCGQCHTPRNANGELDQSRKLKGSSVFLQPP